MRHSTLVLYVLFAGCFLDHETADTGVPDNDCSACYNVDDGPVSYTRDGLAVSAACAASLGCEVSRFACATDEDCIRTYRGSECVDAGGYFPRMCAWVEGVHAAVVMPPDADVVDAGLAAAMCPSPPALPVHQGACVRTPGWCAEPHHAVFDDEGCFAFCASDTCTHATPTCGPTSCCPSGMSALVLEFGEHESCYVCRCTTP